MAVYDLPKAQVAAVSAELVGYIIANRQWFARRSKPLPADWRDALANFFDAELLNRARLCDLRGESIENPSFYPSLRSAGISALPNIAAMRAVTFNDVILTNEECTLELAFHELVHVEQYRQLTVAEFARRYVRGFLDSGSYAEIPLEVHAYQLSDRFAADRQRPFSVAEEVRRWIEADRF